MAEERDEKHDYKPYDEAPAPPIPTYEEATSSRPSSAQHLGPRETGDDAERQAFLTPSSVLPNARRRNGYHAPSVQSVRSSEDSEDFDAVNGMVSDDDEEGEERELRREVEEMDVEDGGEESVARTWRRRRRDAMRQQFQKRMASLTNAFSALSTPFRGWRIPWSSFSPVTDRIPTMPTGYKPAWPIVARIVGLFIVVSLVYALFVMEVFGSGNLGALRGYNPEWVRQQAQGSVDEKRIKEYLKHVTSYSHIAGSEGDFYLAQWVENHFKEAGMQSVHMQEYQVYLNYPKAGGRKVAIIDPPDKAWEARLEEEPSYLNPSPQQENTMVFHGHSRAGNVTGPLIYVNYGSHEDFKTLQDSGISVNGSIALVRYYGSQGDRALKVKEAEQLGAAGVLIYSDPAEDGFVKGEPWPKGRWRPSDGVQRGA
ncbi:hypothetical protein LTS18_014366, partial [Coniosporium uncinatum]